MKTQTPIRKRNVRPGLRCIRTVTRYLGTDRAHADRLITQDGLPVISVPTAQGAKNKVPVPALHRWLKSRSSGFSLTLDELHDELDRLEPGLINHA